MTRIYLVDSENIGASWSQLLPSMSKEDKMFVFYTEKSPYISYDNLLQVIAHCDIPIFIKCYEGKNALDFQLVSELGFKLCQEPEAEFVIISDDYGYDPAIRYWKERMYNVRRIGKKNCKPMTSKKMEESVDVPVAVDEVAIETEAFEDQQPVAELLAAQVKEAEAESVMESIQVAETEYSGEDKQPAAKVEQFVAETEQPVKEQEQLSEQSEQTMPALEVEVMAEQPEAEQMEAEPNLPVEQEASNLPQDPLKENQPTKRARERRKKHKKELAKEPESAVEQSSEKAEEVLKQAESLMTEEIQENSLDLLLLEITEKCKSEDAMKDAFSVKEMFCSFSMNNLTDVNTALKSLIGNEVGNDIYRELKERQECRILLDTLYIPDAKRRFKKYVQTVLDRSNLEGVTAKEIGDFLLAIPRKNLNSIRSAMIKEYGHEQGSLIYTIFKPHIKVLNNI